MAEVADVRQTNTASFESVALYQQPLCVYVYTHTHTHTHTHTVHNIIRKKYEDSRHVSFLFQYMTYQKIQFNNPLLCLYHMSHIYIYIYIYICIRLL